MIEADNVRTGCCGCMAETTAGGLQCRGRVFVVSETMTQRRTINFMSVLTRTINAALEPLLHDSALHQPCILHRIPFPAAIFGRLPGKIQQDALPRADTLRANRNTSGPNSLSFTFSCKRLFHGAIPCPTNFCPCTLISCCSKATCRGPLVPRKERNRDRIEAASSVRP